MCKFWLVYTKVLPRHLLLRLLTCWQSPWQAQGTLEKFTFLEKQNKNGWMANFPFYLCISLTELVKWWKIYSVFKTGTEHFLSLPSTLIVIAYWKSINYTPVQSTLALWIMDMPIIQPRKKINFTCLTEVNSCHYRLSLLKTLTRGPWTVRYKESWLY